MILQVSINYLAILVATIASMVIGMTWYSETLFGKQWIKCMGWTPKEVSRGKKECNMTKTMFFAFVSTFIGAYVLALIVQYAAAVTVADAIQIGAMVWLGFMMPLAMSGVLWEGRSWKLFMINAGHTLTSTLVMSVILTLWI